MDGEREMCVQSPNHIHNKIYTKIKTYYIHYIVQYVALLELDL